MLGVGTTKNGPMTWKLNLAKIFVQCTYPPSFIIQYLNCLEVIVLTNKQADSDKMYHLALLCYAGEITLV